MAAMSGTFSNLSRSPSASGRAGHPGHAYSMLSRLSRFPTLFRRDRPGQMPRMSRLSRLSENLLSRRDGSSSAEAPQGLFRSLRALSLPLRMTGRSRWKRKSDAPGLALAPLGRRARRRVRSADKRQEHQGDHPIRVHQHGLRRNYEPKRRMSNA